MPLDEIFQLYFLPFTEIDHAARVRLLAQCLTDDAEIMGPGRVFKGHNAISEKIERFQNRRPGERLVLASGFGCFENIVRFEVAIVGADNRVEAQGSAVAELAASGKISRVMPFWDALPPVPESWPPQLVR